MRGYVLFSLLVGFAVFNPVSLPNSQLYDSPPPTRQATTTETYMEQEWWLLAWADSSFACRVLTEKEGLPGLGEVRTACGAAIYKTWLSQPSCSAAANGGDVSGCQGYYLYYIGSHPAEREVVVELPPATAVLTLEGCTQTGYETTCPLLPTLHIQGVEPLPDHSITQVHYEISGHPSARNQEGICTGDFCILPLSLTTLEGQRILFWVDSSFGDSSEKYEAFYRVKPAGDGRWEIQVISEQGIVIRRKNGEQEAVIRNQANEMEWQAFPPLGENQSWLSYPADAAALASSEPYQYLSGQLIRAGAVDVSGCADGGLMGSGYASQCGIEQAMSIAIEWQNRFDQTIFDIAGRYDMSPQLLKNVIAQESQFWPGLYAPSPLEYGLARLTETGADTLFRWNDGFYASFCSQILWDEVCASGYNNLAKVYQEMLRGALATRVNVYCEPCEYGFDLQRADFGIEVLAQTLLANAAQVEQMLVNLTKENAGASARYDDLWRFTLANYNAGPGCLGSALIATQKGHVQFTWENVAAHLVGGCKAAIGYVESIAK